MKRIEAEKLLGGYATGTLTEDERRTLFAAAVEHQEIFDALADEEALRELLADPAAKAQLLAALRPEGAPKVVPFWRRPALLGAAAGLMVAATAGLAYLRSPEAARQAVRPEAPVLKEEAPVLKSLSSPPLSDPPAAKEAKVVEPRRIRAKEVPSPQPAMETPAPPPAAEHAGGAATPVADAVRLKALGEARRAETQDSLAKKAEAARPAPAPAPASVPVPAAAMVEVLAAAAPSVPAQTTSNQAAGDHAARDQAPSAQLPAARKAKTMGGLGLMRTGRLDDHTWILALQPDGTTCVTVSGPPGAHVEVLKRAGDEVVVLRFQSRESLGTLVQWRYQVRLAAGDALDLYVLPVAVPDPARLPELAPVNGYRMRIHPAPEKK